MAHCPCMGRSAKAISSSRRNRSNSVTAMVAVSMPGYSKSHNEALVLVSLSFAEEMHGSRARIRLMRSTTGWRVKCVQPNFYM